jgi:hypothetical protein
MAMMQNMAKILEQQSRMIESFSVPAAASHQSLQSRAGFMPTLTNQSRADVMPTLNIGPRADVMPTLGLTLSNGSPEVVAIHGSDARPTVPAESLLVRASTVDSQIDVCNAAASADAPVEKVCTAVAGTCALLNILEERDKEKVLQGKAKAKANANSKSNANDKEHTPKDKEYTPKKRCSRKTPDEHAPKHKDHTPEKPQTPNAKHKEHTPKTSNRTPDKKQNKAIAVKRPFFSLEKSRGQLMCRTGVGGAGSTYQISFGACKKYTSESAARAAAERWVRGECARRGIERS